MCHCRLSVLNPKYRSLIAQGALTMDEVVQLPDSRILVPCGHCSACRRQKALTWRGRLLREYDDYCAEHGYSDDSPFTQPPIYFVTLTVNDKYRSLVEDSPSKCMRLFFENIRQASGKSIRHWFIVEYGDYKKHTGRIHFHGLFFGLTGVDFKTIRRSWIFGERVDISRVRSRSCMTYVTKYVTKGNSHALVYARTGRFPYLSKIYASSGIGSSLYADQEARIVAAARSLGPITVSWKNFEYAVPYYYIAKFCNRCSEHIMPQRRILNSILRQTSGYLRYFGILERPLDSATRFESGLAFLPARLKRYAHLAQLESNPSPLSIDSARRSVLTLLNQLHSYVFDHLCASSAISQIECSLRSI